MKYTIDKEHRIFFQKNGSVELEDLLSAEHLSSLNAALNQALAIRCSVLPDQLNRCSSERLFLAGRDLWRTDPEMRKWVSHFRFAEIAGELLEQRTLRLGYDQLLPSRIQSKYDHPEESVYVKFLQTQGSLNSISCLQGILCGLILPLTPPVEVKKVDVATQPTELSVTDQTIDLFSRCPGNAVFFCPDKVIDFQKIYSHLGQRYLLIVYTQSNATYRIQIGDPHTHMLKRLGYSVGDRLNDKFHPIVLR